MEKLGLVFSPLSSLKGDTYKKGFYYLSFDDGWLGNIEAFKYLLNLSIKPALFVASSASSKGILWTDLLRDNGYSELEIHNLKRVSNNDLSTFLSNSVLVNHRRKLMSFNQLHEIKEMCEIGLHTHNHAILTNCSSEAVLHEISENWKELLPLNCNRWLAYPNGDYNERVASVCDSFGLEYAFTTSRHYDALNIRMGMPRVCIPNNTSKAEIYARISGLHEFLRSL